MVTNLLPIRLVGANGDLITFNRWSGQFLGGPGARGFGIAPTQSELIEGAGDGSVPRFSRRGARDIDVPVTIVGESRSDVLAAQRRLVAALRWAGAPNPLPRLQYVLESGAVYELGVLYVAGAETQFGDTAGEWFCRWLLTLRAPAPYWVATAEQAFSLRTGNTGRGLLPHLSKLQVSSSQVLGTVSLSNPGDVEAPIRWEITGPGGPFEATIGGVGFTLLCDLSGGDSRVVDATDATVVDGSGVNVYDELDTAPKLLRLPPGSSTVNVSLADATSDSLVVGLFRPRLEVVF